MSATDRRPLWAKLLIGLLVTLAVLVLVVVFFPWDTLREPVNRYVSEKTGRHFAITRRLDVKVGRTTRVLVEGIEFANPDWAQDRFLVRAAGGEIQVRLLPLLLHRRIELPLVSLREPELGLQVEPDGRRTWALGRDTGDRKNVPDIGAFQVDRGKIHFVATEHGADIHADFAVDAPLALPPSQRAATPASSAAPAQQQAVANSNAPQAMPLTFDAKGTWQKEAFTARGRTGNVLYLSAPLQNPFPMELEAAAGDTRVKAKGAIASLATMEGADAVIDLQGRNLADLYKFVGVVLPATPRYTVHGHVTKKNEVWNVADLRGKLGNSDLAGELAFDRRHDVPHLSGQLRSQWLDFQDLAPLIGMSEKQQHEIRQDKAAETQASVNGHKPKKVKDPNRKVLPHAPIDLARLHRMNSEVSYVAAKVTNVKQLPLERIAVNVRLENGVLNLDKLDLGVAGGTLSGKVRIDGHANPAAAELHLGARALELRRLLKDEKLIKSSYGKIYGDFDLKGRGNSVAQMLGTADGNASLLMGPGQISNLLLEFAGLDGGEILKFLLGGDQNVRVRCGATAFDVHHGLMTSRALVLDTVDTVIYGDGTVNLGTEALDLYFKPYPKDKSILSLRSPLKLTGTLGAPKPGPDKAALGGRAGAALALGAINPLLALAATIETGPGKDANCGAILHDASSPNNPASRADFLAQEQRQATSSMGGPGGKLRSLLGAPKKPAEEEHPVVRPPRLQHKAADASSAEAAGGGSEPKTNAAPSNARRQPHAPGAPDRPYGS